MILDQTEVLKLVLNAIFTGIGITIGSYLANKTLIRNLEKLVSRINNEKEKAAI